MFKRILIANRGEIACRIIRTARRMGIETFAVYSLNDRKARHVREADRAICIGPPPLDQSYLNIEKIIQVAQRAEVEAIHPGYGFLSENVAFAEACQAAGVSFIGPTPQTMQVMGSKESAKNIAEKAGLPVIPGYQGEGQDLATLKAEAQRICFPLMIKVVRGGGGKGMRRVETQENFEDALRSCQREAHSSFGHDRVLLEKALHHPRHIEVQIFGDTHGNRVHLFERDCSLQRRHQKIIEEAPAWGLEASVKEQLWDAALKIAQAVDYVGAGTVEFLVDQDHNFTFMEMNTRLQVEHTVTEAITGLDLVEWQLRVAAGESLPFTQDQITCQGHALQLRIYAEDPHHEFLPSSGTLSVFRSPEGDSRLDSGVEEGDEISSVYDPLIAKLIVREKDRESCLRKGAHLTKTWPILGVHTNLEFLESLLNDPDFSQTPIDVGFVDRHLKRWVHTEETPTVAFRCAAVGLHWNQRHGDDPWSQPTGWRLGDPQPITYTLESGGLVTPVSLAYDGTRWVIDEADWIEVEKRGAFFHITCSRATLEAYFHDRGQGVCDVWFRGKSYTFKIHDLLQDAAETSHPEHHLTAPMTSTVVFIPIKPGDQVTQGQILMVLEAMKMEHPIRAPQDGHVGKIFFQLGDVVEEGTDLLEFEGGSDDTPLAQAS